MKSRGKPGGKTLFAKLQEEQLFPEKIGEFFKTLYYHQGKTLRISESETHRMG